MNICERPAEERRAQHFKETSDIAFFRRTTAIHLFATGAEIVAIPGFEAAWCIRNGYDGALRSGESGETTNARPEYFGAVRGN